MSLPNHVAFAARKALSQRWHAAKATKRIERGVDADTLRRRALHDARGQIVRHGCTYYATGEVHWEMRRSRRGRSDQLDYIENGAVELTGGPRRMTV
tara:strand:- start:1914 stop:2204 length:291 start_codon:yes stop_codon:yes gene_type:complete